MRPLIGAVLAVLLATTAVATLGPARPAGAATPAGPFTVDVSNREAVRQFFLSTYQASEGVPAGWTGDVAQCNPGTVSDDFLEATRTRINYFRAMAGIPSDVVFTPENNAKAQTSAVMMSAQRDIDHNPPATWPCWTQVGAAAAGKSNLQIGATGPAAIDALMADHAELGHRRTILNPQNIEMGSGSIPDNPAGSAIEVQYMADNPDPTLRPARDGFVAWPPRGFVPYQITYPFWHFSLRGADFANATVSMTRNGQPLAATVTSRVDFAGPGIVWQTGVADPGTSWPKPTRDDAYRVTLGNVVVAGTPRTFTYDVTVFDPANGDPNSTPLQITGPDAPPVGVASTYTATTIPNTTGYQWRTTRLLPITTTEGAEGGLGPFTATVGSYEPVVTSPVASGTKAYRLMITGDSNPANTATLTDQRLLVPGPNARLAFKSRAISTTNIADRVQISTDDGATWTTISTDPSTDDAAFVDRTVPLAAFAGQRILLRFRAEPAFTGGWTIPDQFGWYVDDVTLTDTSAATVSEPVLTPTPTFTVTPADAAPLDLEVRPQFVASGFGPWSAPRRVNPAGPPVITTAPASTRVAAGATATFTVAAVGPGPLGVVWALNGTDLADGPGVAGSRTTTLQLGNVGAAQAGTYTARVGNAFGSTTSSPATLTVDGAATPPTPPPTTPPTTPLATALDGAGLTWSTAGDGPWAAETAVTHDGVDAARSGAITDNQSSRLETTVTGPATVGFWWKVDSEATFDFLNVELDGARPFEGISGSVDWQRKTITVPAGAHTIRWTYSKDVSESRGQDAGWVDDVSVTPAGATTAPAPTPAPPANQPTSPLAAALDVPTQQVATTGDALWTVQTDVNHGTASSARSGPVGDNQASRLLLAVSGPATVSFWWKVDSEAGFDYLNLEVDGGQPFGGVSGGVDWQQRTVTVGAGAHFLRWTYSKDLNGTGGQDAAWVDQVVVGPADGSAPFVAPPTLAGAVDADGLAFTSAGALGWTSQAAVTHDGVDAARSGAIGDSQSSRLETTVTGPATLTFWWKVDSEQGFDFLRFELDGARPVTGISGSVDWQQQTVTVPAGSHSARWTYVKDSSDSRGLDTAWVDQVNVA